MNQAELLRYVVETLDTLGIDYMVSGSHASIYYGEPRMTQDIDVVADVTLTQEGGSERHLRDVAGMLRVSGPEIDSRYIGDWAQRLGVGDIWQAVRRRAEAR